MNGTVYPVYDNAFKVQPFKEDPETHVWAPDEAFKGKELEVGGMESFSVSIDNGIEEFNPLEEKGWVRRLLTAKSISISLSGKRVVGNPGNEFIASFMFKSGPSAMVNLLWTTPDKRVITVPCVVSVTSVGGDSTAIDGLEVELLSDGKPSVEPAFVEPVPSM